MLHSPNLSATLYPYKQRSILWAMSQLEKVPSTWVPHNLKRYTDYEYKKDKTFMKKTHKFTLITIIV